MSDVKLKHCPFCGGEPKRELQRGFLEWQGIYSVYCLGCGASTNSVSDWNRRNNNLIHKDKAVKKLLDTFSEYQIVAHDGRGRHGEHYFVREKELRRIIEESLSKELNK